MLVKDIVSPVVLREHLPLTDCILDTVNKSRKTISKIIVGLSEKILVVVGPCSIHNYSEALEYADFLAAMREKYSDHLEIVMRVYFEKPRTRDGWKGLVYDPWINGSNDIANGLELARRTMIGILDRNVPIAHELLDSISPNYLSDLISWGAIGARTVESQIHRQIASGSSYPIGFKNSTEGNVDVTIDAIKSCEQMHSFLSINESGYVSITETPGNKYGHVILRGGAKPNYFVEDIENVRNLMQKNNVKTGVLVDLSHGNSGKCYRKQTDVLHYLLKNKLLSRDTVCGVMIESNLVEGAQTVSDYWNLKKGISITDSCLGLSDTEVLLQKICEKEAL